MIGLYSPENFAVSGYGTGRDLTTTRRMQTTGLLKSLVYPAASAPTCFATPQCTQRMALDDIIIEVCWLGVRSDILVKVY